MPAPRMSRARITRGVLEKKYKKLIIDCYYIQCVHVALRFVCARFHFVRFPLETFPQLFERHPSRFVSSVKAAPDGALTPPNA